MSGKNSFALVDDPPAMIGTRMLDAPRDLVFAVWTDPTHLAKWWGPNGAGAERELKVTVATTGSRAC